MTDKKEISVSIMPTYECQYDCNYCYLPKELKSQSLHLSQESLFKRLKNISDKYNISIVELYGGDLFCMFEKDLKDIIAAYRCYCKNDRIMMNDVEKARELGFSERHINISINPERRDFLTTLYNARRFPSVNVTTVVTKRLLLHPIEGILGWYKGFTGNVTMIPYNNFSPNYPISYVSNSMYCSFMMAFIDYYLNNINKFKFKLTNIIMLQDCINGMYSPAMRNNIFITPKGKFACVDFREGGEEYFHEFHKLEEWEKRCATEDVDRIKYCGTCENFNCCMAEHHRNPNQLPWFTNAYGDVCSGYKPLVDWAKERLNGFSY